ncbi:MAG: hypothetical protein M1840_002185 [Geoglossum simile]|nr:MAG: hypothetical protein M1840_002185 [Geoglossum simile]
MAEYEASLASNPVTLSYNLSPFAVSSFPITLPPLFWGLESKVGLLLFDNTKLKKRGGLEETSSLYTHRQNTSRTSVRGLRAEMSANGWAPKLCEAVRAYDKIYGLGVMVKVRVEVRRLG